MKRYIQNPETKKFIDADGVKGKKIKKEKMERNQQVQLFSDKEGKTRVDTSSSVMEHVPKKKRVERKKKESHDKKNKVERKKKTTKKKVNPIVLLGHSNPEHRITPIQRPDPVRVMRLVEPPVVGMSDLMNNVLRMSMDTFHEENQRRCNNPLARHYHFMDNPTRLAMMEHDQVQRERQFSEIENMMNEDVFARERQEKQRERENLDNNMRNFRVVKFTIRKNSEEKEKEKKKNQSQKLRIENQKLKEKLENQKKTREEQQKRLKALEKRLKKK